MHPFLTCQSWTGTDSASLLLPAVCVARKGPQQSYARLAPKGWVRSKSLGGDMSCRRHSRATSDVRAPLGSCLHRLCPRAHPAVTWRRTCWRTAVLQSPLSFQSVRPRSWRTDHSATRVLETAPRSLKSVPRGLPFDCGQVGTGLIFGRHPAQVGKGHP